MAVKSIVPAERIEQSILFLRGEKVMLDADLAVLYGVETRVIVQAVKRNISRFPGDFMFRLSDKEYSLLKSHSEGRGGRRYPPYVFTEQGVAMLSSVLNSQRAIMVNIEIMRAFVRLRQMMATHEDLTRKLDALEKKYDMQFSAVFDAIRQLMEPPKPRKKQIGFHWKAEESAKKKEPKNARPRRRKNN